MRISDWSSDVCSSDLRWVDRAKKIEPSGQVVISQSDEIGDLLLENGDIIRVPVKDGLVLVSGEVLFPNAIAFDKNFSVGDDINRAGEFPNNAHGAGIIVKRQDGSFIKGDVYTGEAKQSREGKE